VVRLRQPLHIGDRTYRKGEVVTIPQGEEVPPEIVATASPKQLQAWGFDPLKHAMPVKIPGLHRAEDLVKDPILLQKADARLREYIGMVKYKEYAYAVGGKLKEYVDRHEKELAVHRVHIAQMQGEELDESDPKIQWAQEKIKLDRQKRRWKARIQKAEQARQELEQKHQQAEQARQQAEQARQELEQKHQQAEQARQRTHELLQRAFQTGSMEVAQKVHELTLHGEFDAAEELLRQHESSPAPRRKRR